jgi:hypothetical protein
VEVGRPNAYQETSLHHFGLLSLEYDERDGRRHKKTSSPWQLLLMTYRKPQATKASIDARMFASRSMAHEALAGWKKSRLALIKVW